MKAALKRVSIGLWVAAATLFYVGTSYALIQRMASGHISGVEFSPRQLFTVIAVLGCGLAAAVVLLIITKRTAESIWLIGVVQGMTTLVLVLWAMPRSCGGSVELMALSFLPLLGAFMIMTISGVIHFVRDA